LRDAIRDGETGLVVPPGDVDALRAAVERLLGDPALRERLGTAARADAQARFSRTREGDALVDLWQRARLYRPHE
jgi:glycosyltransferase involved in cell wall biosynthesis